MPSILAASQSPPGETSPLLQSAGAPTSCAITEVDHHPEFRLIPMAPHRGWPVSLCEAAIGLPLPSYATRRQWRAALPQRHSSGLLVFTDAANSTFVWTWRYRYPTGHSQYVEIDSRTRPEVLRAALARIPTFGMRVDGTDRIDPEIERPLCKLLQRGTPGVEGDRIDAVLQRIEECDNPEWLRSTWRKMRGISVLHPDCENGDRLLQAAAALEMLFVAVLERMRAFVADSGTRGSRRRPEHLRDMRDLTTDAEDRRWDGDTRRFVRRLIVQQNLFAVARTRVSGRAIVRDLAGFAGLERGVQPPIDCNVWRLRRAAGVDPGNESGSDIRAVSHLPAAPPGQRPQAWASDDDRDRATLSEELELHRKAWEMVRRVRLAGGAPGDLRQAVSQLERRRQLLRRQLREMNVDPDEDGPYDTRFCRSGSGRAVSIVVG